MKRLWFLLLVATVMLASAQWGGSVWGNGGGGSTGGGAGTGTVTAVRKGYGLTLSEDPLADTGTIAWDSTTWKTWIASESLNAVTYKATRARVPTVYTTNIFPTATTAYMLFALTGSTSLDSVRFKATVVRGESLDFAAVKATNIRGALTGNVTGTADSATGAVRAAGAALLQGKDTTALFAAKTAAKIATNGTNTYVWSMTSASTQGWAASAGGTTPYDSAGVSANTHQLQGKDTTALWNAKTLQGRDTTTFARPGDTVATVGRVFLKESLSTVHTPNDTQFSWLDTAAFHTQGNTWGWGTGSVDTSKNITFLKNVTVDSTLTAASVKVPLILNTWYWQNCGTDSIGIEDSAHTFLTRYNQPHKIEGAVTFATPIGLASGGTGATTQQAGFDALAPTTASTGAVTYWNGTHWVAQNGNTSGTKFLSEDGSGNVSWGSAGGTGTVTSISQGTGMSFSANPITSTGTINFDTTGHKTWLASESINMAVLAATRVRAALTGNVTGNASGSSGSCTGNAATASTASACSGNSASSDSSTKSHNSTQLGGTAAASYALLVGSGSDSLGGHLVVEATRFRGAKIPRTCDTASTATPHPNCDLVDQYDLTALAAGATFAVPAGTPVNGQKLIVRVLDNGGARTVAFNTGAGGYFPIVAFPTTTVISKTLYMGFIYNSVRGKWDLVASVQE